MRNIGPSKSEITARIVALALFVTIAQPVAAPAATAEFSRAISLVDEGEALYRQASEIVSMRPRSASSASAIANPNAKGGQFYRREGAFQDAMKTNPIRIADLRARRLQLIIGNLDTFLWLAVQSTLSQCNSNDGALNLKVARAILDEARREIAGRGRVDFEPPQITDDNSNRCDR